MGAGRLFRTAASVATLVAGAAWAAAAFAQDKLGQPTDKAMGWQPSATSLKVHTEWFYNDILFPVITVISLFVLALLIWIVVRYNKRANPTAAKFSHNTLIEIVWTAVPVAILVVIAVFSLSLLKEYNDMPTPDVVVKATGNQWYWTYDYPELAVTGIDSKLRDDARDIAKAHAAGIPYLLETDNQLVIPVGKVIHIETTATDVIHSWTVPAFGPKIDAIPGRLNNGWFRVDKVGTYYGQCSELCGQDHAYMPIEVKVVTPEEFDAYIIAQGGKTKAMQAADAASAAAASQAAADAAAASAAASSDTTSASAAPASEPASQAAQ